MSHAIQIPLTYSLQHSPRGDAIRRVMQAALSAVEPGAAVHRHLQRDGDILYADGQRWNLRSMRHVYLVAVGKASLPMAQAAVALLGDRLHAGIVITRRGQAAGQALPSQVRVFEASHPVPGLDGVQATRAIHAMLQHTTSQDLVLAMISGGGSALLTSPVDGVSLDDMQTLTRALLACGAEIGEINTLRKHLDAVKGGGLARWASPADMLALVLSDVVGSPLDVIASGPTVPDTTTFADALAVLERYEIQPPRAIQRHLVRGLQGDIPENPAVNDPLFRRVRTLVVGDNLQAAQAAVRRATQEGFHSLLLTTALQGEARQAGRFLAAVLREVRLSGNPAAPPACLVAGGETTVTLQGNGLGGRNQELALGAVEDLAGLSNVLLVTLATDGSDGPTDAAGAVVTGETLHRAREQGLSPRSALANNDSYTFFAALDDLLKTGPTHTNVNDLTFLFAG